MLTAFLECQELIKLLKSLARERLTAKQKKIIIYLEDYDQELPVTRLVARLAEHLSCSESTVWNNLNQLKRIGILIYGDKHSKGTPVGITRIGRSISEDTGGGRPCNQ